MQLWAIYQLQGVLLREKSDLSEEWRQVMSASDAMLKYLWFLCVELLNDSE